MKNKELLNKLYWVIICGLIYVVLIIAFMGVFFTYGSGLLLLYMPLFIFSASLIGVYIWWLKFKDLFCSILLYLTYVGFGFAFVFLVPFAVERSMSTFVFFYAAQNGSIPELNLSQEYKDYFFKKRIEDGVKGNFLVKEGNVYKPTLRTKIYYHLLYPFGVATNMLNNYETFVKEIDKTKNTQYLK